MIRPKLFRLFETFSQFKLSDFKWISRRTFVSADSCITRENGRSKDFFSRLASITVEGEDKNRNFFHWSFENAPFPATLLNNLIIFDRTFLPLFPPSPVDFVCSLIRSSHAFPRASLLQLPEIHHFERNFSIKATAFEALNPRETRNSFVSLAPATKQYFLIIDSMFPSSDFVVAASHPTPTHLFDSAAPCPR